MKRKKFFTDDDLIFIMVVMFMLSIFGPSLGRSKNIMRVYECEEAQLVESEEEQEQVQKKQKQVQKKQKQVQKKQKQVQKKQKQERLVTVTRYNPVIDQCDDDPLITADNSEIDLKKLKANKLRWVAVSRDLLGEFSYGDTIRLTCRNDPSINGKYTIHDCMNKRWKNRVDILTHIESDHGRGKWEDVKIIREGN